MQPGGTQTVPFTITNMSTASVILKSFGTLRDIPSIKFEGPLGAIPPGRFVVVTVSCTPDLVGFITVIPPHLLPFQSWLNLLSLSLLRSQKKEEQESLFSPRLSPPPVLRQEMREIASPPPSPLCSPL